MCQTDIHLTALHVPVSKYDVSWSRKASELFFQWLCSTTKIALLKAEAQDGKLRS